jgi:hypothetical protein
LKKLLVVLAAALVGGAYWAGYWPQRTKLESAQAESFEARRKLGEASAALAGAERTVRLSAMLGDLLALRDAVELRSFAEARLLSSSFFDRVRNEWASASDASLRAALDSILARRDGVTAGLAREEANVGEALGPVEADMRRALGYPVPARPTPLPVPPAAAPVR